MFDVTEAKRLAEEARKALEGVTAPSWVAVELDEGRWGVQWADSGEAYPFIDAVCAGSDAESNARFIAYARSGVPALATKIDEAAAEIERLRERLERVYTIIRDDDLSEPIADNGMTVLDGLQNEARALLGGDQ